PRGTTDHSFVPEAKFSRNLVINTEDGSADDTFDSCFLHSLYNCSGSPVIAQIININDVNPVHSTAQSIRILKVSVHEFYPFGFFFLQACICVLCIQHQIVRCLCKKIGCKQSSDPSRCT